MIPFNFVSFIMSSGLFVAQLFNFALNSIFDLILDVTAPFWAFIGSSNLDERFIWNSKQHIINSGFISRLTAVNFVSDKFLFPAKSNRLITEFGAFPDSIS